MYKVVSYGTLGEVIKIDGKFSCAVIERFDAKGFNGTLVYFVKDDALHVANVYHDFITDEQESMREGNVLKVIEDCNYRYIECSTEEFIEDFKALLKNQKRTQIEAGTGDTVLVHYLCTNNVYVSNDIVDDKRAVLQYMESNFKYGTSREPVFDGYPDLNEGSTEMNFMLCGGNVQDLKKCMNLFETYTSSMDIKY